MSARRDKPAPMTRGPLTFHEHAALLHLLGGPLTVERLAAFGAATLLNHFDVRGAFGSGLASSSRKRLWVAVVDAAVTLATLGNPQAPAMATPERRAAHARYAQGAIARLGAVLAPLAKRLAASAAPPPAPPPTPPPGNVVPFPPRQAPPSLPAGDPPPAVA